MPTPRKHSSLARRVAPALLITGTAGAFLLALDRPRAATDESGDTGTTAPADDSASAMTTSTTTRSGSSGSNASGNASSTVPTTPTCSGDLVEGSSISTKYGAVQVAATVSADGTICDIKVERAPSGGKSGSITSRAVPILRQRALAAQDATFDGVSGATYTSQAYKKSLQAVIDAR
jgi:uncharacterized protein with FMN-binding domain